MRARMIATHLALVAPGGVNLGWLSLFQEYAVVVFQQPSSSSTYLTAYSDVLLCLRTALYGQQREKAVPFAPERRSREPLDRTCALIQPPGGWNPVPSQTLDGFSPCSGGWPGVHCLPVGMMGAFGVLQASCGSVVPSSRLK